nr:thioredoxin family protein [Neptunicella marina]
MLLRQDAVFRQHYDSFSPGSDQLQLMRQLTGKRLVVLFGRWCHDSQREVPKLLKLLTQSNVALERLTLIAVDRQKTTPDQLEQPFDLKYTPTIILFDQQAELGRIIETPQQGIAEDLAAMLSP